MFCAECGRKLNPGQRICPSCGHNNDIDMRGNAERNPVRNENFYTGGNQFSGIPIKNYNPYMDYTPIGMWGYFGYTILFALPMLGWIFAIIFSVGATKNINLRNFARSYFCIYIIAVGVVLMLLLIIGGFTASLSE